MFLMSVYNSCHTFSGDDTSRMPPCGEELHQSVSPVLAVQTEGQRHKRTAQPHARDKACHLIDPAHIKYDYENENGEQAAGEEEEVLRPQPLELHLAAHAFIDRIFGHRLKEKRTQNRGGDDQEDTGSEPARSGFRRIRIARCSFGLDRELLAVFEVSGSPELNF